MSGGIEIRVLDAGHADEPALCRQLAELEREVDYPLGHDRFRIDHGRDYFAFCRRLGRLRYAVAMRRGNVIGAVAGVLRDIPCGGGGTRRAWYLCDLKVAAGARGMLLARRLVRRFAAAARAEATAGYGISMNPAAGTNRVVRLAQTMLGDVAVGPTLQLYSLDREQVARHAGELAAHLGSTSFLSLAGVKDIVLTSTGRPMPLLHLQHGPHAAPSAACTTPMPGATHMVCAVGGGAIDRSLRATGARPDASATVLHAGLDDTDWSFVLSSDI